MNRPQSWREYGVAVLAVAASSFVCFAIYPHLELTNLVMIYLLGTLLVATRGHRGPAALASSLSVLTFDFCFVPPRFAFTVESIQYVWTFVVMFGVAMITSHLTIRMREEARAAREGRERVETERLRSSLLSSVSHDLRTPLAAILGSADALGQRADFPVDTSARELLGNIRKESGRLSTLVSNLLEATRLESGAVAIQKEPNSLEDILGVVLERLEEPLKQHGVQLDVPEDLPMIPMDVVLVEQLLINLLENALRYAPPLSRIEISARALSHDPAPGHDMKGKFVMVTIADQGPGLRESELERVFDKFYRDDNSPGAGLGLSICRGVVVAHGGSIWALRRPEGGAVFNFTLPL